MAAGGGGWWGLWITKASFLWATDCIQALHSWASPWQRLEGKGSRAAEPLSKSRTKKNHLHARSRPLRGGLDCSPDRKFSQTWNSLDFIDCGVYHVLAVSLSPSSPGPSLLMGHNSPVQWNFNCWTSAACNYGFGRTECVCVSLCVRASVFNRKALASFFLSDFLWCDSLFPWRWGMWQVAIVALTGGRAEGSWGNGVMNFPFIYKGKALTQCVL